MCIVFVKGQQTVARGTNLYRVVTSFMKIDFQNRKMLWLLYKTARINFMPKRIQTNLLTILMILLLVENPKLYSAVTGIPAPLEC